MIQDFVMSWQVPVSFNTGEEDFIRDQYEYESTKELQQKLRDAMKSHVLEGYDGDDD